MLFQKVQAEIARRNGRCSDDDMLAGLRQLLKRHGSLNKAMIDNADGVASTPAIARRFGSLSAAYAKVGFRPVPNNKSTKINRRISLLAGKIGKLFAKQLVLAQLQHIETVCRLDGEGASVIVLLARYIDQMTGSAQWYVHWDKLERATVAVIGLMDSQNTKVNSYHVVTGPDMIALRQRKSRDDGRCLHAFAQPDLSTCVSEVARHMRLFNPGIRPESLVHSSQPISDRDHRHAD